MQRYFSKIGMTIADPNTGSKIYWCLINEVLNKSPCNSFSFRKWIFCF